MTLHEKLNAFFDEAFTNSSTQRQYDVEKARAMTLAYSIKYRNDEFRVRGIETPFTVPIHEPVEGKQTKGYYCGIVDLILQLDQTLHFGDHKTVKDDPREDYWLELKTNPQISHYQLLGRQLADFLGLPVGDFLWDVIVKPGIVPKDLSKKAIKELEGGAYGGIPFTGYSGETFETPQMYGTRVLAWYNDNHETKFVRRMIECKPARVFNYLKTLNYAHNVDTGLRSGALPVIENYSGCNHYGRLCEYHPICRGDDPDKQDFAERQDDDKVPAHRKTGKGALSPSRVACLSRCRQMYQFKYIDKIGPKELPYSQPLELGDLVHKGIEIILKEKLVDPIVLPNQVGS